MKERQITINGTTHQITITEDQASAWSFVAVDADGEIWLFDREPKIRNDQVFRGFVPGCPGDCCEIGQVIHNIGGAWVDTLTDLKDAKTIFSVSDPDAMAEAVRSLIATRLIRYLDKPDFKKLLEEVTALIKAGN